MQCRWMILVDFPAAALETGSAVWPWRCTSAQSRTRRRVAVLHAVHSLLGGAHMSLSIDAQFLLYSHISTCCSGQMIVGPAACIRVVLMIPWLLYLHS